MENVVFDDQYKLGIPLVDYEHEKLFITINNIIDASKDVSVNNLLFEINIEELIKYANFHFSSEEELMAEANYQELEAHKVEHDNFKERIVEYKKQFLDGNLDVEGLIKFLVGWLTNHIQITDRKYEESFRKAGIDTKEI